MAATEHQTIPRVRHVGGLESDLFESLRISSHLFESLRISSNLFESLRISSNLLQFCELETGLHYYTNNNLPRGPAQATAGEVYVMLLTNFARVTQALSAVLEPANTVGVLSF